MARWRQAVELAMTDEEIGKLAAIARSRSEAARRVERAQILLAYREKPSFFGVGQRLGRHHQTVQRCVERDGLWPAECILISARAATRPNFTSRSQVLTIASALLPRRPCRCSVRTGQASIPFRKQRSAADGKEHEIPRIVATLDRRLANKVGHRPVRAFYRPGAVDSCGHTPAMKARDMLPYYGTAIPSTCGLGSMISAEQA